MMKHLKALVFFAVSKQFLSYIRPSVVEPKKAVIQHYQYFDCVLPGLNDNSTFAYLWSYQHCLDVLLS